MKNKNINDIIDNFIGNVKTNEKTDEFFNEDEVISSKDGLVERINKKFIIEDGRQLLQD
jgi:hypothetical protein